MSAHADLPLTVEDLITDKNKIKLDVSLAYTNSSKQGVSTGEPVVVQTGVTSFVMLPTVIGQSRGDTDAFASTLGLRYGLTGKAEIYGRTSHLYNSSRNSDVNGIHRSEDSRFIDAWLGVNYQFKQDDKIPALMGFAEIALREKHSASSHSFKSTMLGLTSYTALDPVVFSITAAYRWNQSRQDGMVDYKPGNLLLINPSIAFAVNDRVTLTTATQWSNRQADSFDGKQYSYRHTNTDLVLGVGYGISKGSSINFTFKTNASGSDGADLRLNWLHKF